MSMDPEPHQPLLAYHTPSPNRRPTAVRVLAIVGIVLASLSLLSEASSVAVYVRYVPLRLAPSVLRLLQVLLPLILNAILLLLCIRAIRFQPGTPRAFVRWAWAYLGWIVLGYILNAMIWASATMNDSGMRPLFVRVLIMQAIYSAIRSVYPALILLYMRRPRVRAAFDPASDAEVVPLATLAPAEGATL